MPQDHKGGTSKRRHIPLLASCEAEHTGRLQSSQQQTTGRLWIDQAGTKALLLLSQSPRADLAPRVPVSALRHLRPSVRGFPAGKSCGGAKELTATRPLRVQSPLSRLNSAVGDSMGQVGEDKGSRQGTVTHTEGLTGNEN